MGQLDNSSGPRTAGQKIDGTKKEISFPAVHHATFVKLVAGVFDGKLIHWQVDQLWL